MKRLLVLAFVLAGCNNVASVDPGPQYFEPRCSSYTKTEILRDSLSQLMGAPEGITFEQFKQLPAPVGVKIPKVYRMTGVLVHFKGDASTGTYVLGFAEHRQADPFAITAYVPLTQCDSVQLSPYYQQMKAVEDSLIAWYGRPLVDSTFIMSDSVEIVGVARHIDAPAPGIDFWALSPVLSITRY